MYQQYQIVVVRLDPTLGAEIKKTRPCVIVSPNEMNQHLNTIIICPLTSQGRANYPTRIRLELESQENWIMADQIRTVDKIRVIKKIGELAPEIIEELKNVMQEMFVN
jgi:mRNA interferase MazF